MALDLPSWELDGRHWPNRSCSSFVEHAGFRWHLQRAGAGPVVLLIHGTGASTHSFSALLPLLAARHTVIAPDLPGHAFTRSPPGFVPNLSGMASALAQLLQHLGLRPQRVVGHSAGAAIGAQLCLTEQLRPTLLFALNGAFFPFRGLPGLVFPQVARWLGRAEAPALVLSARAKDPANVRRVIESTGSFLSDEGLGLYQRLAARPGHLAAVLGMLAVWDLAPLVRSLPTLSTPLHLLVGARDRAVPPSQADDLRRLIPTATITTLDAGHLVHEEQPEVVAKIIEAAEART
jgi:magnesium chelatase accessory protein